MGGKRRFQGLRGEDLDFIENRRGMVRLWPLIASILLIGLALLGAWMYVQSPFIIDPRSVAYAIQAGTMEDGTLRMLAMLTPVLMLMLLSVVAVIVLFGFACIKTEARYQALIAVLLSESVRPGSGDCTD